MKKHIFFLLVFIPISLFSQGGNSGMKFLLSSNSRISAMGESYITLSENASAVLGNPAGLMKNDKTNIELGVRQYIQDISTQYVLVKTRLSDIFSLGFHLLSSQVPDIEIRTKPGEPEGTFTSQDLSTGLSLGFKYNDNIHLGITAKYLFEKIYVNESSGYAIDFGTKYIFSDNITFCAALNNLGKMDDDYSVDLPTTLGIGSLYNLPITDFSSNLLFSLEAHNNFLDKKLHLSVGFEPSYNDIFCLRFGYITGYDSKGFSAGMGLKYRQFDVSYSYTPFLLDLGNSHNISIGFNF
jgi:hypothetical protein